MALRTQQYGRVMKLRQLASQELRCTQERYKLDHDKNVHFELKYVPGDYIIVYLPPLKISATKDLVTENYSIVTTRCYIICCIINAGPETGKV